MINLFKYHSSPQTLYAFNDRTKLVPEMAYEYARDVINGRWPEGESTIAKDPVFAFMYITHILKRKRWKKAEPAIMKDPYIAFMYARDIIEDRWKEAEPIIMNSIAASAYAHHFNIVDI